MSRTKHVGFAVLYFGVWAGSVPAQTPTGTPSRTSSVVAQSGDYQETEEMLQQRLRYAQFLAFVDFSPSDAAALKADMIAGFRKEPAQSTRSNESITQFMQKVPNRPGSLTDLEKRAILRFEAWKSYSDPQQFRDFQSYPMGRMILKYNPVLINSGGMIVTKADVYCQFFTEGVVARAAGVAPPGQAEKDQFIRSLPSRFASMPTEQKLHLTSAEEFMSFFGMAYFGTTKTRAALKADIRRNVHSSADVPNEARQVENDTGPNGKYRASAINERATTFINHSLQSFWAQYWDDQERQDQALDQQRYDQFLSDVFHDGL